jgi:hypothetical protein
MIESLISKIKTSKVIVFLSVHFNETKLKNCLLLSLFIKALYLLWQAHEHRFSLYPGCYLALANGDALEYIASAQNLLIHNVYYPDAKMPGYSLLLSLFFRVSEFTRALDMLVLFQFSVSVVSVFFLAKTAFLVSQSRFVFVAVFFSYLLSTYISVFDKFILSECLAISSLIFSMYFFVYSFSSHRETRHLVLCGIFAALAVFLRSALFVVFISYILFLMTELLQKRGNFKSIIIKGCCIVVPFLMLDGFWIKRNLAWHNNFIPLMSFQLYIDEAKDSYYMEEVDFVETWGGDVVYWEPKAEIRWFGCEKRFKADTSLNLPSYIYTSAYNLDSLMLLRKQMRVFDRNHDLGLKQTICQKFERYTLAFKTEKKFIHTLIPLKYLEKLVLNSGGTYNLYDRTYSELGFFDKTVKLGMITLFELFSLPGVLFSFIWFSRPGINAFRSFFSTFIVINLCTVTFVYRLCEFRYFAPNYPFCLLMTIVVLHTVYQRFRTKKNR